jgi:hypothetical protein
MRNTILSKHTKFNYNQQHFLASTPGCFPVTTCNVSADEPGEHARVGGVLMRELQKRKKKDGAGYRLRIAILTGRDWQEKKNRQPGSLLVSFLVGSWHDSARSGGSSGRV